MLTDTQCKKATCPRDKKYIRLSDSGGMYLEVTTNGGKWWRLKYRFAGKEKRISLGVYPQISLLEARKSREEAKAILKQGLDPSTTRKEEKEITIIECLTFKEAALQWYNTRLNNWSNSHAQRIMRQLERDLFPYLGNKPVKTIKAKEILEALKKIEARGAVETADRSLMLCRQIWNFLATDDIPDATRGIKEKLQPYRGKHFGAIIEPERFGELLRAIQSYQGGIIVRSALQLAPLLFQRPYNLRTMQWAHVDLENALWTIPSEEMKREKHEKEYGEPHYVPLPKQALQILEDLYPYTGHGKYVFHGQRQYDRPISDNSVRSALYTLGFGKEQTWHGFRSSGRTMLAEQLDANPLYLEAHLAHAVKDANGRAYNRTQYLKQRTEMIQQWADYCDQLKNVK